MKLFSNFSFPRIHQEFFPISKYSLILTAIVVGCTPALAEIRPAYTITTPDSGDFSAIESSLGFFFTVDQPGYSVNAFGFYKQDEWLLKNDSYSVYLWSYLNGGVNATDYTLVTPPLVFKPSNISSYTLDDQWWYQFLPKPVALPVSMTDEGYLMAAVGNFNGTNGLKYIAEGMLSLAPPVTYYRPPAYSDSSNIDFPLPLDVAPPYPNLGYWNANLSLVPGPLPIAGAAVGYGIARRLRQRIRRSR